MLLLAICGFVIVNSSTGVSRPCGITLVARDGGGAAAGLAWALLAGYARRMVTRSQQGRALAIAMVGTPIALSIGVPTGTWLGAVVGWRPAFGIMSGLTLLLIVWVLARAPDFPGVAQHERLPFGRVLRTPGVRTVVGAVVTWMIAHNVHYTYIVPF